MAWKSKTNVEASEQMIMHSKGGEKGQIIWHGRGS